MMRRYIDDVFNTRLANAKSLITNVLSQQTTPGTEGMTAATATADYLLNMWTENRVTYMLLLETAAIT